MSSASPTSDSSFLPPQAEPPSGDGPAPIRRWRPIGVLYAFALGLAGTLFAGLVLGVVVAAAGGSTRHLPSGVNLLLTVVQDGAFAAGAIFVASLAARPAPWQFGLRAVRWRPLVGWTLLAFLAYFLLSYLYGAAVHIGKQEELPDQLGADNGTLALVAAAILTTVVAPLAEEFFFRGFVFTSTRNAWGLWPAALFTGALFGAIHLGSAPSALYLPILAVFGTILCLLYARTGSLYPCIVLHVLNNSIAFGGTRHGWTWEYVLLTGCSLATIGLVALAVRRFGPAPPVE